MADTYLKYLAFGLKIRDGSVLKMCTSVGRKCKTVLIPELRVLVQHNRTWTSSQQNHNKSPQMHKI